jgi:hypothetical protein
MEQNKVLEVLRIYFPSKYIGLLNAAALRRTFSKDKTLTKVAKPSKRTPLFPNSRKRVLYPTYIFSHAGTYVLGFNVVPVLAIPRGITKTHLA